jgi:hypothetical protein
MNQKNLGMEKFIISKNINKKGMIILPELPDNYIFINEKKRK